MPTTAYLLAAAHAGLILFSAASAVAAGLVDPAKQAAGCQQAIAKAGKTFAATTMKSLDTCWSGFSLDCDSGFIRLYCVEQ